MYAQRVLYCIGLFCVFRNTLLLMTRFVEKSGSVHYHFLPPSCARANADTCGPEAAARCGHCNLQGHEMALAHL